MGLVITIGLGLASRSFQIGIALWDKSLGDVLYTVMIYFLVAIARPDTRPTARGTIALAISVAVELFQLTGIPLALPRILRIALGTTFAWHDVACYVVGAVVASAADHLVRRRSGAVRGTR